MAWYAVGGVVGVVRMLYNAGIPHMGGAELAYALKHACGDVVELAGAVLLKCAADYGCIAVVGKQAGQKLIYDWFLI